VQLSFQSLIAADASREQIEEWCRSKTQSYAVPLEGGPAVACRVLGKYIMYGAAADSALMPHLALNGIWEPWVTMAIAHHVKPGMRCMDVGACYGYYALLLADIAGPGGHVQAWEPVWDHIVTLNAQVNGLPVQVIAKAMASSEATLSPVLPRRDRFFNAGDVKLIPYDAAGRWFRKVDARPPELGDPAAPEEPWDFIKIDVEGAEADVWMALAGVRSRSPSLTVCMEFTPKSHPEPRQFLEQIHADGFAVGTVGHDGVPRPITTDEALVPDTGDFRMLWLTRWKNERTTGY